MEPLTRALRSLDGLSVGDAFGELFFMPGEAAYRFIRARAIPGGSWRYTDDTEMAISIVEVLAEHGSVDQDALAAAFAARMDPSRRYGAGAYGILTAIREGLPWERASRGAFHGRGSFGNGAAMRVAPLGAYFADDLERCVAEARLSSEITHAHEEGIAGGVAIALATALCWRHRNEPLAPTAFLEAVRELCPESYTREGIEAALRLPEEADVVQAAQALGNGSGVTAPDTVPLCLWLAARHSGRHVDGRYVDALWETVAALGDRDTTCAIVGGILAMSAPVPAEWLERREPLPEV